MSPAAITHPRTADRGFGLYVHLPWCVAKCPYCDFNSYTLNGDLPVTAYVDALLTDLSAAATELKGRPVTSVFFGGGTPSLFPPAAIGRVLDAVHRHFDVPEEIEVTMEANPGAVEHGVFRDYLRAGVNRLSLGVQSFDDDKLRLLGRIHDSNVARRAYAEARDAGFANINVDLMYALPRQSLQEGMADVEAVVALAPEHISYYHLTLEPNTVFFSRPPPLPDDDLAWEIQQSAAKLLQDAGYINYEVSAWGSPERECLHNLNYWRYGDYLGIGAGAHSKFVARGGTILREVRCANPREYMRRVYQQQAKTRSTVDPSSAVFEFMLNNLRLRAGFTRGRFEATTGLSARLLDSGLTQAFERGLLAETALGAVRPTPRGWLFLDDLQALFLPEG